MNLATRYIKVQEHIGRFMTTPYFGYSNQNVGQHNIEFYDADTIGGMMS